MTVMQIGEMRMIMVQRGMRMEMRVWRFAVPAILVLVLMVRVVFMAMIVLQYRMHMCMRVMLTDMQPHAERHECTGQPERKTRMLRVQQQRDGRAHERCRREIRARACRA